MKVLNLDKLEKVVKTITLQGVDHNVKEMSVGDFIFANQETKRLEALKATPGDTIEQETVSMIKLLLRVVPTIKEDQLLSLTFEQLQVMAGFVNGVIEEEAANAPVATETVTGGDDPKN